MRALRSSLTGTQIGLTTPPNVLARADMTIKGKEPVFSIPFLHPSEPILSLSALFLKDLDRIFSHFRNSENVRIAAETPERQQHLAILKELVSPVAAIEGG